MTKFSSAIFPDKTAEHAGIRKVKAIAAEVFLKTLELKALGLNTKIVYPTEPDKDGRWIIRITTDPTQQ